MCFPDTHTIPVMSSTFQLNIKLNKNKKQWCKGIYSSTLKLLFWRSSEYLERYLTVLNHLKLNWVPIKKGLFTKEAHILCLISAGWHEVPFGPCLFRMFGDCELAPLQQERVLCYEAIIKKTRGSFSTPCLLCRAFITWPLKERSALDRLWRENTGGRVHAN